MTKKPLHLGLFIQSIPEVRFMIIRILESSLQSSSLFFLGKHLFIILASDKKGKFLKRGERMIPKRLYWRNLWGGGNVDTVYCSCTVKNTHYLGCVFV